MRGAATTQQHGHEGERVTDHRPIGAGALLLQPRGRAAVDGVIAELDAVSRPRRLVAVDRLDDELGDVAGRGGIARIVHERDVGIRLADELLDRDALDGP